MKTDSEEVWGSETEGMTSTASEDPSSEQEKQGLGMVRSNRGVSGRALA